MSNVKNADAYSRLVGICTGYGGKYNPGRPTLQLKAMRALLTEAQSSLQDVSQTKHVYKNVTNEREVAFAQIGKLANRIVSSLEATGVMSQTVDDARFYARLINGIKAKSRKPVPSEDAEVQPLRSRMFTQQSYVAIADHFGKLVQMLSKVVAYKPNEEDLQVPALEAKASLLGNLNVEVAKAKTAMRNAMNNRNRIFYKGEDALVKNAAKVKSYVRAVFGLRSAESKQVSELRFTKPKVL